MAPLERRDDAEFPELRLGLHPNVPRDGRSITAKETGHITEEIITSFFYVKPCNYKGVIRRNLHYQNKGFECNI